MARIGFGCFIPQGWKRELRNWEDPQAAWGRAKETARAIEAAGYDSIWVYDHFHNVPKPSHEAVFECWTVMAALTEVTSRVRLGQMVGCAPYRPPAHHQERARQAEPASLAPQAAGS